jgi:hypothetical protein
MGGLMPQPNGASVSLLGGPVEAPRMVPVAQVGEQLASAGRGFETFGHLQGSTFEDSSTVVVVPTRGLIPHQVTQRWLSLISPMNQKRGWITAAGHEVGRAYDAAIKNILEHPELGRWKYVLTLEDDNLPPPDAHIRLLEAINYGPKFDAVSGIYFTKGDFSMPMAYGDPDEFARTGVLDFKPLDVRRALERGTLVPVNGIAMGCALWRLDLFREVPPPWFVTVADLIPEKGVVSMTQDLYFCRQAREKGKRFAVDCRVRVGHLDVNTGIVY